MTSGVVVTKSSPVVVRPSELELATLPPPSGDTTTVALSSFDRRVPPISVTSLLVFDRAIDAPVETIKAALSRALAHYRPIAGRLDSGAGIITCTDEGVTFVGASASCALADAMAASPHQTEDLALYYPGLLCRDAADPLLMVQVTAFACGGFTVGVTSNHVVADGVGTAQFLHAVAELARGVVPSVAPVRRWDDGADCYSSLTASPAISAPRSTIEQEARQRLARVDVVVPYRLIGRIKAAEEQCTVLEAVMAVLWRCRTRAATSPSDADRPALLNFACDMRALAGAPAGYYGNCLRLQVVPATAGAVAGSSIGQLVRLIRLAKEKVPDLLLPGPGGVPPAPAPRWYEIFNVTDWRNLGLHTVDFGGGVPARVLWHNERTAVPFCVVCPARRKGTAGRGDDDGVDVSSRFLKPEHADAFLAELAALADASSPSAE
ncbi:hypothetical protein U9M48_030537 [Paspalum notatum var. saurae]|uniref:Uncharacterized protein n=1 Tax=Paspalum notatum var. saurae TaxID=547442 RepID=A0AAQ3U383_PASNO